MSTSAGDAPRPAGEDGPTPANPGPEAGVDREQHRPDSGKNASPTRWAAMAFAGGLLFGFVVTLIYFALR